MVETLGQLNVFFQIIGGPDAWEPEAEEAQNRLAPKGCFAAIAVKDDGGAAQGNPKQLGMFLEVPGSNPG